MVDVTIRGTAGAMEHPAEAVDLFLETFARYQPEGAADEWRVYLKSWSPESLKHPELEFLEEARVSLSNPFENTPIVAHSEASTAPRVPTRESLRQSVCSGYSGEACTLLVQGGGVGFLLVGNVVGAAGFSAPLRLSRKNQRGFGWKRARFPGSFPCKPSGSHHLPRGPARVSRKTLSLT